MKSFYTIEYRDGITRVQFSKRPTFSDAQSVIDDIVENYPYERRLWDLSNIKFDFTMDEIEKIAEYGKRKFIKPNKVAIIAPDDLAFGEMRAFEVYREQEELSVARGFRNEEQALAWLRQ